MVSGHCFPFYDSCLLNEEVINNLFSSHKAVTNYLTVIPVRETSTGLGVFRGRRWESSHPDWIHGIQGDGGAATVHTCSAAWRLASVMELLCLVATGQCRGTCLLLKEILLAQDINNYLDLVPQLSYRMRTCFEWLSFQLSQKGCTVPFYTLRREFHTLHTTEALAD